MFSSAAGNLNLMANALRHGSTLWHGTQELGARNVTIVLVICMLEFAVQHIIFDHPGLLVTCHGS